VTVRACLDPASDLCQRWRARRHSWRHRSEGGFDASRYDVAPLAEADARTFVATNHYAASYAAARLRFGLYDGAWLVGVAVLGVPMQRRVLTTVFPDLEPYAQSLELSRFVFGESVPANGESWFLARCWELAGREGVRGVVSFSDPVPRRTAAGDLVFPGHIGTIYQTSNTEYLGLTTPRRVLLLPDGRPLSAGRCPRSAATSRGTPTSSASSPASARGRGCRASRVRTGSETRSRRRPLVAARRQPSLCRARMRTASTQSASRRGPVATDLTPFRHVPGGD
jgi:hypothetical protein